MCIMYTCTCIFIGTRKYYPHCPLLELGLYDHIITYGDFTKYIIITLMLMSIDCTMSRKDQRPVKVYMGEHLYSTNTRGEKRGDRVQ